MIIIQREDKVIANQLCQQINDTFEIYKYVLNLLIPLTPLPQIMSEAMKDATALCCPGGQGQPWKISQGLLVELSGERSAEGPAEENGQKPGQGVSGRLLGGAGKALQTIHQDPSPYKWRN